MKLEIRKATIDDCQDIYDWRTDEKNSENSFSGGDFSYEKHKGWFKHYLEDTEESNLMLILELNDKPCCVVRFDGELNHRTVSIYMVPGYHGKKLGLPCLLMAELYLRHELQGLTCNLDAEIMIDNEASIKIFTRAGYIYSMADWYKVL